MTNAKNRTQVLEALGHYQKKGRLESKAQSLVRIWENETDRGIVVIMGSLLEDLLLQRILENFVKLTPTQAKNLTRSGGVLGSFSHMIDMAFALGVIDEGMVDMLKVIKAMRNASAHSRQSIAFDTPELSDALLLLLEIRDPEHFQAVNVEFKRFIFIAVGAFIMDVISGLSKDDAQVRFDAIMSTLREELAKAHRQREASLKKQKTQPAKRTRQSPKGTKPRRPPRSSRV